jgi:Ion channel
MANTPNQPLSARCARVAGIIRGDATFKNLCPRLARILFPHDDADRCRCCSSFPQSRFADCHLVAFAAALAANLFRHESRSVLVNFIFYGAELAFVIVLASVVGQAVFGHGRVTFHRIQGAIAFYLLIAVIFAYFYLLLVTPVPNAFNQSIVLNDSFGASRLLYFSFATLTTTGYGDIAPVHPLARSLANLEAVIGQLFPATLLARIVTLELAQRRH